MAYGSAWVLARSEEFGAAMRAGDVDAARSVFALVANRAAQGEIFAERSGLALPADNDPCWEAWAREAGALPPDRLA